MTTQHGDTARADQLETGAREMLDALLRGSAFLPPPARRLVLESLVDRLGVFATELTSALEAPR